MSGNPNSSAAVTARTGLKPVEIEPGRTVPYLWDHALFESWEDRKARRASERAARNASLAIDPTSNTLVRNG